MGTTANPRDVWDFLASTSSINHTVDEGKHIWIQGFPLASSNPDSTYYPLPSKPEADSASITHQGSGASSLQSPLAAVGGNELPQKDYYWMTIFNSQIPISRLKIASPVKTEAAQAPDLNLFIFGHHIHKGDEMAKQKRKEGHPQCPYSRCSKHFMRAGGRRPVSGLGALSRQEKSDLPLIASSDWTGFLPLYTGFCGTYYEWHLYLWCRPCRCVYNTYVLTVNLFGMVIGALRSVFCRRGRGGR